MKKLKIEEILPGSVLRETIPHPYSCNSYVKEGTILTKYHLSRLKKLNVKKLLVSVSPKKNLNIDKAADIYSEAFNVLRDLYEDVRIGNNINLLPIKNLVKSIIDYICIDSHSLIYLRHLKDNDNNSVVHSINVAVFTILLGKKIGINDLDLHELGMAGLLHDIGKAKIPFEILLKPGKLTSEEFNLIKMHPIIGREILQESEHISKSILEVIEQHHEKSDGTGYPFGLQHEEINQWSKIIAIADIYEALTADRSYRKKLAPETAMDYLMVCASKGMLDEELVKLFFKNISIYPLGAKVLLSDNSVGEIVEIPPLTPWRPTVLVDKKKKISLLENRNICILDIVI